MNKRFAVCLLLLPLALPAEPMPGQAETFLPTGHAGGSSTAAFPLPPPVEAYAKLKQIFTFNVPLRLLWKPAAEAARYRLQIAKDADFRKILEEEVLAATQFDPTRKYLRGEYFWHVASLDADGRQGAYSETMHFEYRPIPDRPDIGGTPVRIEEKFISIDLPELPAGEQYLLVLARDPQLDDVVWRGEAVKLPLIVFKPEAGQYYLAAQATNDEGMAGPYAVLPLEIE